MLDRAISSSSKVLEESPAGDSDQRSRQPTAGDEQKFRIESDRDAALDLQDFTAYCDSDESPKALVHLEALRYSTLRSPNIRLVTIKSSSRYGTVELDLTDAPLHDGLQFHALSYTWGDPTDKRAIIVNGQTLDVTENLHKFLQTVREHENDFMSNHANPDYLKSYSAEIARETRNDDKSRLTSITSTSAQWWIDAICITQNDVNERNNQVPRMGDIYSMASRVWVWIVVPSDVFRGLDPDFIELKRALAFHARDMPNDFSTDEEKERRPLFQQFIEYQRQMMIPGIESHGFSITPGFMAGAFQLLYNEATNELAPELKYVLFNKFLKQMAALLGQPYVSRTWTIQEYILNPRRPVALLGDFVFDMCHIGGLRDRLIWERRHMEPFVQVHANSVITRGINLSTVSELRKQWHGYPTALAVPAHDACEVEGASQASTAFANLPAGQKLRYLLTSFAGRQCTNPLDRFYGLLGLLNLNELPEVLLPDYSLPFHQVCRAYIKFMIESTGDLRMIESSSGHGSEDCPSWVPNVYHLGRDLNITVSDGNKRFCFSEDGSTLTLEGVRIGEVITCSCTACPTEYTDKHLEFLQEVLFEAAAEITGRTVDEIFQSWYKTLLSVRMIEGAYNSDVLSMEDLLRRYREVCEDIPLDVQERFNCMDESQMHVLFDIPCRDPQFLCTFLLLGKIRYCLLSTGDIVLCGLKGTNNTPESPSHRWDDCAWALKGLNQLAILRPKDQGYEYCGPARSSKGVVIDPEGGRERSEFDLDDDFFEGKATEQVILI